MTRPLRGKTRVVPMSTQNKGRAWRWEMEGTRLDWIVPAPPPPRPVLPRSLAFHLFAQLLSPAPLDIVLSSSKSHTVLKFSRKQLSFPSKVPRAVFFFFPGPTSSRDGKTHSSWVTAAGAGGVRRCDLQISSRHYLGLPEWDSTTYRAPFSHGTVRDPAVRPATIRGGIAAGGLDRHHLTTRLTAARTCSPGRRGSGRAASIGGS